MKAAYGAWKSPITSDLIIAESIGISAPAFHQCSDGTNCLFWIESRPQEGGRNVLVRREESGIETDITPSPFNIRTRVHEYGGGSFVLHDDMIIFSNFSDQQLYIQSFNNEQPLKLTHSPDLRFANGVMDSARERLITVIEDHGGAVLEPENKIGSVDINSGQVTTLVQGHSFFSTPVLNPECDQLAWITWDHPDMPWDETILWLGDIDGEGLLTNIRQVSGGHADGKKVSVQQPCFSPSGDLYFISDKTGWWNIYHLDQNSPAEGGSNVYALEAEFGLPHWVFGLRTYDFLSTDQIICIYSRRNEDQLAILDLAKKELKDIPLPYSSISGLSLDVEKQHLLFMGASPTNFPGIITLDLGTTESTTIKTTTELDLEDGFFSTPQTIEFPTSNSETAHAFFYPPANKDYKAPEQERPPLIVMLHGGPTGATHNVLSLRTQFWTSRGFAILDVNYRGSTGYGREYRDKLLYNWGIVDVEDTVAGCNFLGGNDLVDMNRLAIRGGSAGGYTTLSALTFTDTFKAGASHFGVSDLEALAKDTHKFESRYLDSMIGPYPEALSVYQERSPIHHVEKLSSACIFFQGLEDQVVPPAQAEVMVDALKEKGIPVAYVPFEGEQHGFRKAPNIKRCLDLELFFYAKIFGFSTADQIEPVEIMNLPT
jgi:dipeptidyl aminopeptidase/acylaminoacyl peptidase